jgi:hypothetical protein
MSKEIGIGRANRLARIGEMVSVSIDGKTITAKVATNLSSTKVLILFDGRTYHAYPESQRAILSSQKTVLAKHERRKQHPKVTISTAILFEVANYNVSLPPRENDSCSYYVSVDGKTPRHILTTSVVITAPIPGAGGGNGLYRINPIFTATLTYFGNGRYRGSIKYGIRPTQREINGKFYIINFAANMVVFTESSTITYGLGASIPPAPEDWQDMHLRDRFVGSYSNERFIYDSTRGIVAQSGDRNYLRNLYIGNVGDIDTVHPCFWSDFGGNQSPIGSFGTLFDKFLPQTTGTAGSAHYNIDVKNQIIFSVIANISYIDYTTTGASLGIQAWNYSKILSEVYDRDVCTMSGRYIKDSLFADYIFPKIEISSGSIIGHAIAGFVTWSNYKVTKIV